tara:strand:+ start:400 stop:681 length:282 start_codon:yes stop_codon:yes gene_type:complete
MKTILLIMHMLSGDVAAVTTTLAVNQWCSDVVDKFTYFEENKNYKPGNGQVWINRKYKGHNVLAHYCISTDGKVMYSYNDGSNRKKPGEPDGD